MLVVSRKANQSIVIRDNIVVDRHKVTPEHILMAAKEFDIPLAIEAVYINLEVVPDFDELRRLKVI